VVHIPGHRDAGLPGWGDSQGQAAATGELRAPDIRKRALPGADTNENALRFRPAQWPIHL